MAVISGVDWVQSLTRRQMWCIWLGTRPDWPYCTIRTSELRALGECRAYIDSLQNEQFFLPHLHILHSSPLRRSEWDSLGVLMAVLQGSRMSSVAYALQEIGARPLTGRTIRIYLESLSSRRVTELMVSSRMRYLRASFATRLIFEFNLSG